MATVLYYASTAAAIVRCDTKTTRMRNADLRRGLKRILALAWVTDPIRSLCEQAIDRLASFEDGVAEPVGAPVSPDPLRADPRRA